MIAYLSSHVWLGVAVPFALALAIAFLGRRSTIVAPVLASVGTLITLALGVAGLASGGVSGVGGFAWFSAGGSVLSIGWSLDALSAVMLAIVGVVATCVVVFSVDYMKEDAGWARYFAVLALFTGSMNLLVIGDTLTTLFVGWELVGACSYLLIGFWYEKPSASAAAIKAFITTRIGDVGLLVGIALLWTATGSDRFEIVLTALPSLDPALVTAAAVCLAVGAMGKSAQFPLHGWLPDAMEGPTPVSALIHAATMVAAGVYLGVRLWPVFDAAPAARTLLLVAGVVSALGAALAATAQRDIKKVLAYSTISQLGFMFAALGAGAWGAAAFHLVTHAAFKALLFLASGSVIHGAHTQDLHRMGGLRRTMPVTFAVWVVGVLALAGVAPLSGFFSKDAVLEAVLHTSPLAGSALFVASVATGFYAARATRLAFFGAPAEGLHAHESSSLMTVPLLVLAVPAAGLGFAHGSFAELLSAHGEPMSLAISAAATIAAVLGALAGWRVSAGPATDTAYRDRVPALARALESAYGWERHVERGTVSACVAFARGLWAVGDRLLADGLAVGSAALARMAGSVVSRTHDGDVQGYGSIVAAAVALALVITVWLGRWAG